MILPFLYLLRGMVYYEESCVVWLLCLIVISLLGCVLNIFNVRRKIMFQILGSRCLTGSALLDCHVLKGFGIYMIGILGRPYCPSGGPRLCSSSSM